MSHMKSLNLNSRIIIQYYYSILSRKLCLRGYGKTNTHGYSYDRYTREEQKKRERAYNYARSILKSVLECDQG